MARRNVGAHHRLHHIGKPDTGARQIERIHRIVDHRVTGCLDGNLASVIKELPPIEPAGFDQAVGDAVVVFEVSNGLGPAAFGEIGW